MNMEIDIEKELAKEMEGKLFAHIYMSSFQGKYFMLHKDYYTVIMGIVHCVNNRGTSSTGDKLMNIKCECRQIGKYDPKKNYKPIRKELTYNEINKFLLNPSIQENK